MDPHTHVACRPGLRPFALQCMCIQYGNVCRHKSATVHRGKKKRDFAFPGVYVCMCIQYTECVDPTVHTLDGCRRVPTGADGCVWLTNECVFGPRRRLCLLEWVYVYSIKWLSSRDYARFEASNRGVGSTRSASLSKVDAPWRSGGKANLF